MKIRVIQKKEALGVEVNTSTGIRPYLAAATESTAMESPLASPVTLAW